MAIDSSCPPVAIGDAVDAQQLGHHRKSYLEYEGPLSGDRGQVHRIDSGNYFGEQPSPTIWRIGIGRQHSSLQHPFATRIRQRRELGSPLRVAFKGDC